MVRDRLVSELVSEMRFWRAFCELLLDHAKVWHGHIYIGIEVKLMSDRFNEQLDWAYLVLKWAYLYQIALV